MNGLRALVWAWYDAVGTFGVMFFCFLKFSTPSAPSLAAITVDFQMVDVANCNCVQEMLVADILAAGGTLVTTGIFQCLQAFPAEELSTAVDLMGFSSY